MRIISQDGMNDYPYDRIVVYVNHLEHNKIGATVCGDSYDIELGEYDSEEDAKFALQYFSAMYMAGVKLCEALSAKTLSELRTAFLAGREKNENIAQFIKRKAIELNGRR